MRASGILPRDPKPETPPGVVALLGPQRARTATRSRGEGHVYQRGRIWWVKYSANGQPHYESTGTEHKGAALRVLRARLSKVEAGEPVIPAKVTYEEAEQALKGHYETTGRRDLKEAGRRLTPLADFFGGWRLRTIDEERITDYVKARQTAGKANGTINRELNVLSRMLRLAYRNKKLARLPVIEMLEEAPPRAGFFEAAQYAEVRKRLRPDLRVVTDLAYTFGWRVRDEVLTLEWNRVDFPKATLRLDPGSTKNREGRVVSLSPGLVQALAEQRERVEAVQRDLGRIIPHVFPHLRGPHVGTPLRDFRRAWRTACRNAGVPGMLRHDFRRTAVRNMERAGVPRSVAMKVVGHKTESVYRRYAIVSEADLLDATRRVTAFLARDATSGPSATVLPLER